ncbi:MAG: cell division protein FtsX [Acidimicrobiia bacterium]
MSRAAYLIRQALTSLRRNALVVAAAILAVFVSLTLAFGALVVNELFRVNTTRWQEGVHVVVFMKDDVSLDAQTDLEREIRSWDEVADTTYCDKTCAWLEFKEMFADQPALLEETDASILPASIRIKLTNVDYYRDITFRLLDNPAVRKTVTAGDRFDQLSNISRILNALGLGLAILLGVASVVLIANTIRMAIYARRDEVSVMKLVGASNWFIRIPFLLEGMLQGFGGAALAVVAVWAGHSFLAGLEPDDFFIRLSVGNSYLTKWSILILLFGAAAGIVGSAFGLRRFLRV